MSLEDTTKTDTGASADAGGKSDGAGAAQPPKAAAPAAAPEAKPAAAAPAADPAKDGGKPADGNGDAKVSTATSIFDDDDEGDDGTPPKEPASEAKEGDAPAEDGKEAAKSWAPDDWRERVAAGDEKHLAELKRYASFETWTKAQRALRQKVSTGEYKKADTFEDGWSDERKAEWRKENGIPDKPDGYQLPEVKGTEWTDADKAAMTPFLERMHARNAAPAVVQEALGFYAEALQMAKERTVQLDREHKITLEDDLRSSWGHDYRANVGLMKRALNDADVLPGGMSEGGVGQAMLNARLPNGQRLINTPAVAEFLAGLARERYGEGAMIPGSEMKVLDDREAEIKRVRNTDIDRYYREKNGKGQTMEQELREIMERKGGGNRRSAA